MHGTVSTMDQYALHMTFQRLERYQSRESQQTSGAGKSTPRRPRSEAEFDGSVFNPKRVVAIVRGLFSDLRTGSSEWGSHCVACGPHHYNRPLHCRRRILRSVTGIVLIWSSCIRAVFAMSLEKELSLALSPC
jgi:hypothetical protein